MKLNIKLSSILLIFFLSYLGMSCRSHDMQITEAPNFGQEQTNTLVPSSPEIHSTPIKHPEPILETSLVSPDGSNIAATFTLVSKTGFEDTVTSVPDNAVVHSALYMIYAESSEKQLVEELFSDEEMSFQIPWPIAWTPDSRSLFYTYRLGGGDGCFAADTRFGSNLVRYDLEDGTIIRLTSEVGYWIALSPDQTKLAFLGTSKEDSRFETIGIFNLVSKERMETPVIYPTEYPEHIIQYPTHLLWSPNGDKLIFSLEINVCSAGEIYSSLIIVSPETLAQSAIRNDDPNHLIPLQWLENGFVLIEDNNGVIWWLNPEDGQLLSPE